MALTCLNYGAACHQHDVNWHSKSNMANLKANTIKDELVFCIVRVKFPEEMKEACWSAYTLEYITADFPVTSRSKNKPDCISWSELITLCFILRKLIYMLYNKKETTIKQVYFFIAAMSALSTLCPYISTEQWSQRSTWDIIKQMYLDGLKTYIRLIECVFWVLVLLPPPLTDLSCLIGARWRRRRRRLTDWNTPLIRRNNTWG